MTDRSPADLAVAVRRVLHELDAEPITDSLDAEDRERLSELISVARLLADDLAAVLGA